MSDLLPNLEDYEELEEELMDWLDKDVEVSDD